MQSTLIRRFLSAAGKIIGYLLAVVLLGALLAPPFYWLGQACSQISALHFLKGTDFQRYFARSILISAFLLLPLVIRSIGLERFRDMGLRRNPLWWRDVTAGLLLAVAVTAALGFVATRTLEGGALLAGAACVLSLVTLQQAGAGTNGLVMGHTLISMYDRIFLLSQSFIPAVNALLIGSLLYQSRLVPRALPLLGFTGAALLVTGDVAVLFGLIGQHASTTGLFAIPIAVWEFSLGVYLVVKGFKPSAVTALYSRPVAVDNRPLAAVR